MEQVDPIYWQLPLHQLINEFGYEWLKEQDRIFNKICKEVEEDEDAIY